MTNRRNRTSRYHRYTPRLTSDQRWGVWDAIAWCWATDYTNPDLETIKGVCDARNDDYAREVAARLAAAQETIPC